MAFRDRTSIFFMGSINHGSLLYESYYKIMDLLSARGCGYLAKRHLLIDKEQGAIEFRIVGHMIRFF